MPETTTVVAVKLRYSPRSYWFDPVLGEYKVGDTVLVDTERGREVGTVSAIGIDATEEQVSALSSPLKPVIRMLDDKDRQQQERLQEKSNSALAVFHELVNASDLEMKPVAVEYLFTGEKAVFYFTSDSRVDFRELVRDLAARLHIRVELRQIGVRDEARMLGGIAHCGERLCCARIGADFQPVSIRMAKEQDLPLNPEKISGACGRLMCCLRHEFDSYKDFKGRAPRQGAQIETPLGQATVVDLNTPRESVTLKLDDGKTFSVPLNEFEPVRSSKAEVQRPSAIGREALEKSANTSLTLALSMLDREAFVEEPEPAEAPATSATTRRRRNRQGTTASRNEQPGSGQSGSGQSRYQSTSARNRQQSRSRQQAQPEATEQDIIAASQGDRRSRRRIQQNSNSQSLPTLPDLNENDKTAASSASSDQSGRNRPGRNSSGLRQREQSSQGSSDTQTDQASDTSTSDGRRRRRRRN
ncbi:MAG: hypothetical protein FWD45_03545 [Coriobacteriia bacterium]|nr:hypothetical protein [Coriobacteriia bacterium]